MHVLISEIMSLMVVYPRKCVQNKETKILVAHNKDTSDVASDNNGDKKEAMIMVADDKDTIDVASVNISENESVEVNNNGC